MSAGAGGDVIVVGGGLAGIAAALELADAGRRVTLLEGGRKLGGRTHSFRRGDLHVDNGQHVFLRCCSAYRGLLERLDVGDRVYLQPRLDIPVRSAATGVTARLRRVPLPAPAHLCLALAGYRPISVAERVRFARAALALRRVDVGDPATDEESFGSWLARHGQSRRAVHALWDLVGVATLNATAEHASLALAATVFQIGLLNDPAAADVGWSLVPLDQLHGQPAGAALAAAGVRVHTGVKARAVTPAGGGWLVHGDTGTYEAADVVLAVPAAAAARLLPAGAVALPDGWAAALGSSPIINVHVVYDRRVLRAPFLAGLDTPIQWLFDRTGPSGLAEGQYLAASLSAADALVDLPVADLRRTLLPQIGALLPAAADAEVRDFFVTRERHATFRPAPGTARLRAGPLTAHPGLYLAGAWTDTGWPATMEGAVRSGRAAAAALLASPARTPSEVPA